MFAVLIFDQGTVLDQCFLYLGLRWIASDPSQMESHEIFGMFYVFGFALSFLFAACCSFSIPKKILRLPIIRRSIICNRMLTRTFLLVQVRRFDGLLPLRLWRESWVYRRSLDDQRQQGSFLILN